MPQASPWECLRAFVAKKLWVLPLKHKNTKAYKTISAISAKSIPLGVPSCFRGKKNTEICH
jgi:hypothetical protein